jgi:hypothetical protein
MRITRGATVPCLNEARSIKATMAESQRMEVELGGWLDTRSKLLRRSGMSGPTLRGLNAPLWRTLIDLWSMSPMARKRYSAESRAGLRSATSSMDATTLLSLVGGLLNEAAKASRDGNMAA